MPFAFCLESLSLLRGLAKRIVPLAVILAISGAPGFFVQGVAWWKMAEGSGGFTQLSMVMFEAAPCHLCCAARELNDTSGDPESPVPVERLQNFRLVATISESLSPPGARVVTLSRSSFLTGPEFPPGSRHDRPDTPPPRRLA